MKTKKHMLQSWYSAFLMVAFFSFALVLTGCEDEDSDDVSKTTQLVNSFIVNYMRDGYLWNDKMPANIDIYNEPDPKELFKRLVYKEYDKWSSLTDNADELFDDYKGISTTFGYLLAFGEFTNSDGMFAIVWFVYPDSPAEKAGLKRGDIIIGMNNGNITKANRTDLYYSSSLTLQMGAVSKDGIHDTGEKVSMNAVKMNLDAINKSTVLNKGQHKIGYICYTDYLESSHKKLQDICRSFKEQGVTDVVLDLRYNPGGASTSALFLSSLLAPASVVKNESLYLKELWNNNYMEYFKQKGEDRDEYFRSDLPENLDLSRVYVLTTGNTASASEATIVGLTPYMDVIKIGTTTYGKYCAAALLRPEDKDGNVIKTINNWGMALVVYKFANANDFTDFKDGIDPDYYVEEDWKNLYPFGDERDPLLGKAVELITGQRIVRAPEVYQTKGLTDQVITHDFRQGGMLKLMD